MTSALQYRSIFLQEELETIRDSSITGISSSGLRIIYYPIYNFEVVKVIYHTSCYNYQKNSSDRLKQFLIVDFLKQVCYNLHSRK